MDHGLRPLLVLVIDAYPDAADSLVALLTLQGHVGTAAYAVADVLRRPPNDRPPDVVLLDTTHPGGDPCEAALLLADRWQRRPLLVAVGGTPEDRRRHRAAGFDTCLPKPIELADLATLLRRAALNSLELTHETPDACQPPSVVCRRPDRSP